MKAYKGFNKDMTCTPYRKMFQYEEGKEYHEGEAKLCESGFHACLLPLNCFAFYRPSKSVYHEVEIDDDALTDGIKSVSKNIRIGANIDIKGLVKAQIDLVFDKAKKEKAATSGYKSSAATSGDKSSAATSGNGSSAATSGEESSAATSNKNAVALACGKNAKAKGVIGSYIVLTEWSEDQKELLHCRLAQVDGTAIKPDVWYKLANGEFVEVPEDFEA